MDKVKKKNRKLSVSYAATSQPYCTHLGQILCNFEFSCIYIVVASFCVTCRDLSVLRYIVQHTTWQPFALRQMVQHVNITTLYSVTRYAVRTRNLVQSSYFLCVERTFWNILVTWPRGQNCVSVSPP